MRRIRFVVLTIPALVLALATSAAVTRAQSAHAIVPADKVQFGAAPPVLPAGAQLAVLEGNPGEKGPLVLRLKLPANYKLPAHWHTMAERVTVLSGMFNVGMGDKLSTSASQPLAPGGFVSLPAKMHHYAWTSAPTIVQINLEGPFDIFYVDPNEDPQNTKTTKK
jgi:hypothetical protein